MPEKSGPWQLDRVKARLRREQVEREEAASARYRVTESQDKNSGKTGWTDGLLLAAVFLLAVSVLLLSSVLLTLVKKT